eukprot:gene5268-6559_t
MSTTNVYISEPVTKGKVVLKTTLGDIEIELWSKEAPNATRNFVQLCLEKYYDGCIFHRVLKNFIAQSGDPTGTGQGGESIYGKPFKDEFHSRLRFNRRGMVGMASSEPDLNTSQFFITLDKTEELTKKHTLFGKVVGDTLFNILKVNEIEIGENDMPLFPPKIISTDVIWNPFDDIVPRVTSKNTLDTKSTTVKKKPIKKNLGLLSFGDEEEPDDVPIKKSTPSNINIKSKPLDKEYLSSSTTSTTTTSTTKTTSTKAAPPPMEKEIETKEQSDDDEEEEEDNDKEIKEKKLESNNNNNPNSFSDRMKEAIIEREKKREREKGSLGLTTQEDISKSTITTEPKEKKQKIKGSLQFKSTSADRRVKKSNVSEQQLLNRLNNFKSKLTTESPENNSSETGKEDGEEDENAWKYHKLKYTKSYGGILVFLVGDILADCRADCYGEMYKCFAKSKPSMNGCGVSLKQCLSRCFKV